MIRIPSRELPSELEQWLDAQQAKIDVLPDHATRVEAAKRAWKAKSPDRFRRIREMLVEMCPGEDRCAYCEDSAADEIEHIRPKDLYPERTFRWDNYLFACGPCNGPKNNRFGVLSKVRRTFVELAEAPVAPPEAGLLLLIDPRREDPMRFMILDLARTFHFQPLHGRCCLAGARAWYTIHLLRLNRDRLAKRRAHAYDDYLARFKEYVSEREPTVRERLRASILRKDHPTVWREMQRQAPHIPDLRALFEQAPEALAWRAGR